MAITKVINDAVDLNQTSDYSGLRLPVGTTDNVVETFTTDYLVVGGGGGGGQGYYGGGGGAGGLRTSYNNSTTTTNSLSFPSGKTAIATYMLNNNSNDISGNYDGTATNVSYKTGIYGGAAVFNGSSSAIVLPNNILSSSCSISAWFYLNNTSGYQTLFEFDYENRILLRVASADSNYAYIGNSGYFNPGITYNPGQWYNIVITFSNGNPFKIYINGVLSYTGGNTSVYALNNDNILGAANSAGANGVDGKIDQVRIYDSELNSTDVSNIYNNEVQALSGGGSAAESSLTLSEGVAYDVTVGNGAIGGNTQSGTADNGNNSIFSTITSTGGGGGQNRAGSFGSSGGSGGGAALPSDAGGNGTLNQGYAGGSLPALKYGAGGGGASKIGLIPLTDYNQSPQRNSLGAPGGDGLSVSITGIATYYSGGGGGGARNPGPDAGTSGGLGGGGDGGLYAIGDNGFSNTGGGGGGGGDNADNGGDGGSGVVILRYPTASVSSFTTTGTLNTPSTTDTVANNNYPTTNSAYYKLDGNANGHLTTNDLGTLDYPSGAGCIALYELNGNANGYLTTTDLSTVNYPAGAGCIALYELNNNANDTSNTYNGGATNVTYDDGAFDQAAVFNGSSSYISANNPNSGGGARSFSAWIKTTSTGFQSIITNGGASYASGLNMFVFNNKLYAQSGNGSEENYGPTSSADVNTGAWVHCVLTMSGTAIGSTLKTYVNGTLDGTYTTIKTITDTYNAFRIGGRYINGSYAAAWFDGEIDQVRIFNTELTQSQVTTLARGASTSYSGEESNITYDTGAFGKAAVFNGSSSLIAVGSPIPNTDTDVAISAWIKLNSGVSSNMHITGTGITTAASEAPFRATLQYQSANTFRLFALRQVAGTYYLAANSTLTNVTINADTWYHVVWSYNSTGRKLSTFLNGTAIDTDVAMSTSGNSVNDSSTVIGSFRSTSGPFFDGDLDQIRFFTSTLTQANVTTLARGAGTAYNGTWNGTEQYTSGRFDQAARFTNDSTSWIDLLTTSTSVFSCSVWVKLDELGTTAQYIIGNSIEPSHPNDKNFNLYYRGDYNLNQFSFQSDEGYVGFGPTIQANRWYHVAWSGNNGTLTKVWVNGQEQNLPTVTSTFDANGEWRVGVWRYRNSSNTLLSAHPLRGLVDQVRIFSTALSDTQVTDLYNEHYQTKFTDGSDTAIMFTEGTGTITFNGTTANAPQGAIRANTSYSEDGSSSVIEHYNGTGWKYFDAVKYCTTNTLNFPIGAGCIASYNFNNNVNDIGNTLNGIGSNLTFTSSGKFGAAAVFNGSSSRIDISNVLNGFTDTYSFSIWAKIDNTNNFSFFSSTTSTAQSTYNNLIRFALHQNGNYYFSFGNVYGARLTGTTPSSWTNNSWHNFVFVSTPTQKLAYVDGSLFDSASSTKAVSGLTNIILGHYGTNYADGLMDQVRIFNDSLNSDEVLKLYNNEIACS